MLLASPWRSAATALTAVLLIPLAGWSATASPVTLPEPSAGWIARNELAELVVAKPHAMTGYSPARFPHWADLGDSCDVREHVLMRDGNDVIRDSRCRVVSGRWLSEYDGKRLTSAGAMRVDHLVPLADAWRSGADTWPAAKRRKFANDLVAPQLIAVSATSDRAKGDQNPARWRPPLRSFWCVYSRAWVDVKTRYKLAVTAPEKIALDEMLDTCPDPQHP
jgi:hypothetical protein